MTGTQADAKKQEIIDKYIIYLLEIGYVNPKILIDDNPAHELSPDSVTIIYTSITNLKAISKGILKNQMAFEYDLMTKIFRELFNYLTGENAFDRFNINKLPQQQISMTATQNKNSIKNIITAFVQDLLDIGYVNPKFLIDYNPTKTFAPSSISLEYSSIENLVQLQKNILKNQAEFEQGIVEQLFIALNSYFTSTSQVEELFVKEGTILLKLVNGIKYWADNEFTVEISGLFSIPIGSYTVFITNEQSDGTGITALVNDIPYDINCINLTIIEGFNDIIQGVPVPVLT